MSGVDRIDCNDCRRTWKDFGGEPPCEDCKPKLIPENIIPINVYCQCSGGLGISPMDSMKLQGVEDMNDCLDKVQFLSSIVTKLQRKKQEL